MAELSLQNNSSSLLPWKTIQVFDERQKELVKVIKYTRSPNNRANMLQTVFRKVYKVSPVVIIHKIVHFIMKSVANKHV